MKIPFTPFNIPKFGPQLDLEAKLTLSIIVSFASSILLYLSIIDRAGSFGSIIGSLLILLLGRAAVLLPFGLVWLGFVLIRLQKNRELAKDFNSRTVWGLIFLLGFITGFLNVIFSVKSLDQMQQGGGLFGYIFYPLILGNFGSIAGAVVLFAQGFFGFFLVSQMSFSKFVDTVQETLSNPAKFWDLIPDLFETWKNKAKTTVEAVELESLEQVRPVVEEESFSGLSFDEIKNATSANERSDDIVMDSTYIDSSQPLASQAGQNGFVLVTPGAGGAKTFDIKQTPKPRIKINWSLPKCDILKENFSKSDPGDIDKNKKRIKETLEHFGISVEMADVVTGPTVSQYTLRPANGVKLSSIDAVQRDLALSLAASSLRLEAPIPGKSLVGIEIPNLVKSQVRIRDIIQTKEFFNFKEELPVAVGEDVAGKKLIYSITKMPHLLVAGATGSGKSVWINSMLLSLLFRYSPQELELILIDMKRVELKLYEGVPHLLSPVITDAEKSINALKWSVLEMDRRYKLLEKFGKRNIGDFNKFVKETRLKDEDLVRMSFLVVVIDELGDLMIMAKNEVEPIIVRLTQMSRAVGIHLILGTQRPDTHVVTGLIKANVPSRIAFAVASQIDSRVILDQGGAEKLLGQGDGLFMSPSTIKAVRFQGCYVEENEVRKCVRFWLDEVENKGLIPNINKEVTEPLKTKIVVPGMVSSTEENHDDFYQECRTYVIAQQGASTSMLQTAFGIGYPKARKIIEMLEAEGVVGPGNGSKPREVYVQQAG
jgi:S-DNA-T family DNA segregation ATPase FtsK/SpoIIIE